MELQFEENEIQKLANRYNYRPCYCDLIRIRSVVEQAEHLTQDQLRNVCKWKSHRSAGHMEKNTEDDVKRITRIALNPKTSEKEAIESLTRLRGVGWATASVILHLYRKGDYPILDYRALWSLGIRNPKQCENYEFWCKYVEYTRQLSDKTGVSIRDLDRALWQYSKEKQKPKKAK